MNALGTGFTHITTAAGKAASVLKLSVRTPPQRKARLGALLLFLALLTVAAGGSLAQGYPNKPIRLIVPFAPGGIADIVSRIIGEKLTEASGQPVIVDNRPGAAGIIGTEMAAHASPDGYTVITVVPAHVINASLYRKLPYDPTADFAPVVLLAEMPQVLVLHPSVPANSLQELIALSKSKPGGFNYASGGSGTATHLAAELFKTMTGANLVHVPYKGAGPAVTALLGGHVSMAFVGLPVAMAQVKAGKLKALGVTGAKRSAAMPDLPTIAESGVPGYEALTWTGLLAPVRTPAAVISKLNGEIASILQNSEVNERLSREGMESIGGTPEQFAEYLKAERVKWAKVVNASGARAD